MIFEGIKTAIPAIPVIANTLFSDEYNCKEETESHAIETVESFSKMQDAKREFEDEVIKWDKSRTILIQDLKTVVEQIKTRKKRSGIAKLTGASVSIVGTVVSIGAIGLSFLTAGFATPIAVAVIGGMAVGATGGVVAGGASIADEILQSKSAQTANELIQDGNIFENLETLQKKYHDAIKAHMKTAQKFDKIVVVFNKVKNAIQVAIRIARKTMIVIGLVKGVCKVIQVICGKSVPVMKIVTNTGSVITGILQSSAITVGKKTLHLLDDIGGAAVKTIGITAFRAAGIAVGVMAIGLDVYTIVKTAIDMHENNLGEAAIEIEKIINELKKLENTSREDCVLKSFFSAASEFGCEIDDNINNSE
ncbi:uncharacterized protein [Antedon mediterranea]|uniref:uncharacterized protein n=1 Tax=Antedon mediterranea TaxID=105859 RepID=UPI003AF73EA1